MAKGMIAKKTIKAMFERILEENRIKSIAGEKEKFLKKAGLISENDGYYFFNNTQGKIFKMFDEMYKKRDKFKVTIKKDKLKITSEFIFDLEEYDEYEIIRKLKIQFKFQFKEILEKELKNIGILK